MKINESIISEVGPDKIELEDNIQDDKLQKYFAKNKTRNHLNANLSSKSKIIYLKKNKSEKKTLAKPKLNTDRQSKHRRSTGQNTNNLNISKGKILKLLLFVIICWSISSFGILNLHNTFRKNFIINYAKIIA